MKVFFQGHYYDFYLPSTRKGLLGWLKRHYPLDRHGEKISWSARKTPTLKAIAIKFRMNLENPKPKPKAQYRLGF